MNDYPSTPLADAVFLVLFLLAIGLAIFGALVWDRLNARQDQRAKDPHSIEHRIGKWN